MLHDVAEIAERSALLGHSEALASMDQVATSKIREQSSNKGFDPDAITWESEIEAVKGTICCGCESCFEYYMDHPIECFQKGNIYKAHLFDSTCGLDKSCGACGVEDICCGCESCHQFYVAHIDECTAQGKIYNAEIHDSTCGMSD